MQCSRDRPVPRRLFYLKPQHFSPSPTARICRRQRWRSAVNTSRRLHGRTTRRHRRGVSFAIKLHSRSDTAEKHAPQVTLRVLRRNTTSHARADAATAAVTATVTRTQTRLQLTSKKKKKRLADHLCLVSRDLEELSPAKPYGRIWTNKRVVQELPSLACPRTRSEAGPAKRLKRRDIRHSCETHRVSTPQVALRPIAQSRMP